MGIRKLLMLVVMIILPLCEASIKADEQKYRLGVRVQDVTNDLARAFRYPTNRGGALVAEVLPNSSAEKNSVQAGDIISSYNGIEITSADSLVKRVQSHQRNHSVEFTYNRDGIEHTATIFPELVNEISSIRKEKSEESEFNIYDYSYYSFEDAALEIGNAKTGYGKKNIGNKIATLGVIAGHRIYAQDGYFYANLDKFEYSILRVWSDVIDFDKDFSSIHALNMSYSQIWCTASQAASCS